MITRRQVVKGLVALPLATAGAGGYAVAEPFRLAVTRYCLTPKGWPAGLHLRIAALADIHACEPWMGLARIRQIAAYANSLKPDLTVLLGDYVAGTRIGRYSRHIPDAQWAEGSHFVCGDRGVSEWTFKGTKPDGTRQRCSSMSAGRRLHRAHAPASLLRRLPCFPIRASVPSSDQAAGRRCRWWRNSRRPAARARLCASTARSIASSPARTTC